MVEYRKESIEKYYTFDNVLKTKYRKCLNIKIPLHKDTIKPNIGTLYNLEQTHVLHTYMT